MLPILWIKPHIDLLQTSHFSRLPKPAKPPYS
jgi:hypothetical protein